MIVTGAFAAPSIISPSASGLSNSASDTFCAIAPALKADVPSSASVSAAPPSQNSRRVMFNGNSLIRSLKIRAFGYPETPTMAILRYRPWASLSLDRGAQSGERGAQVFVVNAGQFAFNGSRFGGVRAFGRGGLRRSLKRRLPQGNPTDRLPAEKAVHPLENETGEMLNFERGRSFHSKHQGCRLGLFPGDRPRPLDFDRLAMRGDFRSGDGLPTRHQFTRGKA